jgi:hypothetical protein
MHHIATYKFVHYLVESFEFCEMRAVAVVILVAAGAVAQQSAYGQCMNSS